MTGPLTTRAALLQILRDAPGSGSDLMRRFERATGGRLRLAAGRVYTVLKDLEAGGLVRSVRLAPKGRRGARERIYYALTPKGVEASTLDRSILIGLLSPPSAFPAEETERERMARRLLEADELSDFGAVLADAPR